MRKFLFVLLIILIAVTAVAFGFYLGQKKGTTTGAIETETKLQPLVDLAFPKPPDDIRNFSGMIKGIYGATINLEINSPEDYLPHVDGTPRKKETRFASLTSKTKIVLIDSAKLDAQGNPKITDLKLADLKAGDTITVRSEQNIKDAKKFDVTKIEMVRY